MKATLEAVAATLAVSGWMIPTFLDFFWWMR
jgi:hypothetical protein